MNMHVRHDTDTAHPQPLVPIYLIHSIEAPFCNSPGCWCQKQQAQVSKLLAGAALGMLQLEKAAMDETDVSVSAD